MRLIHNDALTPAELEKYRQLVFHNLTSGIKFVLDKLKKLQFSLDPALASAIALFDDPPDLNDGEPYPHVYEAALSALWKEPAVCVAIERGNDIELVEWYMLFTYTRGCTRHSHATAQPPVLPLRPFTTIHTALLAEHARHLTHARTHLRDHRDRISSDKL
jgi:hypothetical protein